MKLWHWTTRDALLNILRVGLRTNKMGILYLTPSPAKVSQFGEVLLEVETGDNVLTAFDDCTTWEVLCWGNIEPVDIIVLK